MLSGLAVGTGAVGGVEVGGFAWAAAAASLAASGDGSRLLATSGGVLMGGLLTGDTTTGAGAAAGGFAIGGPATAGGFALGETENGSERTGGVELTLRAVTGGLADAAGAAEAADAAGAAGAEDGRGGAGDEGPAAGAALGFARGTKPEARRAERVPAGEADARGGPLGAAGGTDDVGRGGNDTGDGAAAGVDGWSLSEEGAVMTGDVRGNEPKMSSSSPQPESTFCSSFLSGRAGAGPLARGAVLGPIGDVSQAESSVSLSAVFSGGDSASFMSASDGKTAGETEPWCDGPAHCSK